MTRQTNNTIQLRYLDESTFDTLPSGTSKIWRGVTTETLAPVPEFVESDEEDGTLVVPDQLLVGMGTRGDVNVEWSYGAHDDFTPKAIGSSGWSSELADPGSAVTVTFDNSGGTNTMQLSASTAWNAAGGMGATFARGMWIHVSGASNSVNNGYFRVESATTGDTINVGGATTMTNETIAFSSVVIVGLSQVLTGTSLVSTAIEKDFADHSGTQRYSQMLGQTCTGMRVGFSDPKSIVTGSFSFIGTRDTSSASPINASPTAAPTNGIYTSADTWGFLEDLLAVAPQPILSWSLQVQKADYPMPISGNLRAQEHGKGRINVTGTLETYYEDTNIYARAISETGSNTTALALILENSGGTYIFDVPAARLRNPQRVKGGRDQAMVVRYEFMARYHTVSSTGLRICRKAA